MHWLAKTKTYKPSPQLGSEREKIIFAFLPHKTNPASGPHGWPSEWIWLERLVRMDKYTRGLFSGRSYWWKGYKYYPIQARSKR